MADHMVVLGYIFGIVSIDLPRSHDRNSERFNALKDYLYTIMTNPDVEVAGRMASTPATPPKATSPYAQALPHARVGGISGLLELLDENTGGQADIYQLAETLPRQAFSAAKKFSASRRCSMCRC